MSSASSPFDGFRSLWFRLAAKGWVPARWYLPELPGTEPHPASERPLRLEIVSHCWRYAPFLIHQLSSLVRFPPQRLEVTVTVYHAASDRETVEALAAFEGREPETVRWNWRDLPEEALFRRAIGRNDAARRTEADWIWFTDCDVLFRERCLDELADALRHRTDLLVYPTHEWVTPLLPPDHPMIRAGEVRPLGPDIDPSLFEKASRSRATGPLQIMHGDAARAVGYCGCIPFYQKPVTKWAKAYEDRALRWLLRTGGIPVEIPGVYRIRHLSKGRYSGNWRTLARQTIRRLQSR
jgi:hypothetical protein